MSPFEYVIALISIILGLGITTILSGVAEMIKHRRNTTLYPPYIIWIIIVFILHIHEWWISYQLKTVSAWLLPTFLFIIIYPITLYILAHLLFPGKTESGFNSREFYFNTFPRFFISAILLITISAFQNIFISGYGVETQIGHFVVWVLLVVLLLSKTQSGIVHSTTAIFLLGIMILLLVLAEDQLIIR